MGLQDDASPALSESELLLILGKISDKARRRKCTFVDAENCAQDAAVHLLEHNLHTFTDRDITNWVTAWIARRRRDRLVITSRPRDSGRYRGPEEPADPAQVAELSEEWDALLERLRASTRKYDQVAGAWLESGAVEAHTVAALLTPGGEPVWYMVRYRAVRALAQRFHGLSPELQTLLLRQDRELTKLLGIQLRRMAKSASLRGEES